jgi:hypothetical protein
VRLTPNYREFAEVLVERDDDLPCRPSAGQHGGITRVLRPVRHALNLMPVGHESARDRSGDATVDENVHSRPL